MSTNNSNNVLTSNDEYVKDILKQYPKLQHLKESLKQNIATLKYDLIKEQGLIATLDLLSQYTRIELLNDKIQKTKPTEAPLPRSIRIKIELTSPLEETREAQEFKTLQSEADNTKLYYQQKMRSLITKTLALDKVTLKKRLRESFFRHAATLIKTKIFYELQMQPEDSDISKLFKTTGGSKTASAYTCLKIFENNQSTTSSLHFNFERLKLFLDMTKEDIEEGFLSNFNKDEAEKILTNQTILENDDFITLRKIDINNIITYCSNDMTTIIVRQHNAEVKKRNALATTTATFNSKKSEETTAAVASALSKEGSMSTKTMKDFIEKRIQESLAKNLKSGRKPKPSVNATKNERNTQATSKSSKKRKQSDGDTTTKNSRNKTKVDK